MRSRIHGLTGDNDTGYINTFHGFCVSVLQEDSYAVSYPKKFIVLDNSDIDQMLQIIYDERGLTLRDMTFSDARDMIEIRKIFKEPEYYRDVISMSLVVGVTGWFGLAQIPAGSAGFGHHFLWLPVPGKEVFRPGL